MIDKKDQKAYIEYLEKRVEKLSENSSVGDQDLNTLIDTENEIIANNSYSLKKVLSEVHSFDEFQNRIDIAGSYIEFLLNSSWWKLTRPFRTLTRKARNIKTPKPFDYSNSPAVKEKVRAIIYISDTDQLLEQQLKYLYEQTGFENLDFAIVDLTNSIEIAKIAKTFHAPYINLLAADNNISLAKNFISGNAKFVVYISQGVIIKDNQWLFKMISPLIKNYASASVLYNKKAIGIKQIKKETAFKELKSRIFEIDHHDCMLLPSTRDRVQYIPLITLHDIAAIAKKCK